MSDMRVKTCVLGAVSTNCFLVYHDTTKEAVIIDPADNAHYILNKCSELGISPRAVLLTHGHFDHTPQRTLAILIPESLAASGFPPIASA